MEIEMCKSIIWRKKSMKDMKDDTPKRIQNV